MTLEHRIIILHSQVRLPIVPPHTRRILSPPLCQRLLPGRRRPRPPVSPTRLASLRRIRNHSGPRRTKYPAILISPHRPPPASVAEPRTFHRSPAKPRRSRSNEVESVRPYPHQRRGEDISAGRDTAENPRTVSSTRGSSTILDPLGSSNETALSASLLGLIPIRISMRFAFRIHSADCRLLGLDTSTKLSRTENTRYRAFAPPPAAHPAGTPAASSRTPLHRFLSSDAESLSASLRPSASLAHPVLVQGNPTTALVRISPSQIHPVHANNRNKW